VSYGTYDLLLDFESTGMYEFCRAVLLYGITTYEAGYRYVSLCHVTWFPRFPFSHVKMLTFIVQVVFLLSLYKIFQFSTVIAILKAGT